MQWIIEKKKQLFIFVAIFVGAVLVFYFNHEPEQDITNDLSLETDHGLNVQVDKKPEIVEPTIELVQEPPNTIIVVDIKGAVKKPGVYEVLEGERIIDVIEKAGGLTGKADQSKVNLSKKVSDEMVIHIPKVGEEIVDNLNSEITVNTGSNPSPDSQSSKININQADSSQLETLPGIGPQKAGAIIDYRNENGAFQKLEDLLNISGIGEKTFEKLKGQITLQ